MKSLIQLTISGSTFLFEDKNFTDTEKENLLSLAEENIYYKPGLDEKEISELFIKMAKNKLNITLEKINISLIIRINKNI